MDTNVNKIGFAGTYYTLWNIQTEKVYHQDMNGNAYLAGTKVHYNYIKNISKDLDKAKSLHPDLELDEELYGRNNSWSNFIREERKNENPHLMTIGKYRERDINELVNEDFDYILWFVKSDYKYSDNGEFARNHPKVVEHFKQIEDAEKALSEKQIKILTELFEAGEVTFLMERNLKLRDGGYANYYHAIDGVSIELVFGCDNFKTMEYHGIEYGMPTLNGKAKRTKNKNVTLEVLDIESEHYFDTVYHSLSVKLKSVNK